MTAPARSASSARSTASADLFIVRATVPSSSGVPSVTSPRWRPVAPNIEVVCDGYPMVRTSSRTPRTLERVESVGRHRDPRPLLGVGHGAALEHGGLQAEPHRRERDGRSGDTATDDE